MRKTLLLLIAIAIIGNINLSCSKDKEIKIKVLEGAGTWNNPYKLPVGKTKTKIEPGSDLFVFPYSIGATYTIKLSNFTQDLDLSVVVGYGMNIGANLISSTNEGLDDEELTYQFSQEDLYLHIENLEENPTDFTITITKN